MAAERASDREYPSHPLVGVGAAVFRGGDVLLIRRGSPPRQGEWSLPGGLQILGETVYEAAVREVAEETGITARILGVAQVVDIIERDARDGRVRTHYTVIDVAAAWQAGEPAPASDAADAAWVSLASVPSLSSCAKMTHVIAAARRIWEAEPAP